MRPYKNYIPGGTAHRIIFSDTYYNLFKEVEQIAIEFVLRHYFQSNRRKDITLYHPMQKNVPLDLRIADTFFTHLTLHGKGELRDVSYETLYYTAKKILNWSLNLDLQNF